MFLISILDFYYHIFYEGLLMDAVYVTQKNNIINNFKNKLIMDSYDFIEEHKLNT